MVFCGTPEFAVPSLAAVHGAGSEILLVLTQPDRPVGRGLQLQAPPVKQWALAHEIPVEQPDKIKNNAELRARLEALKPDAIAVVAYGRIIPPWMLALPRLGCVNVHGSLLPKYRGAAPIQWSVANGETVTGVTTMLLEEGLDTGPMLERVEVPIAPDATAAELFPQLAEMGAPLLVSTLARLAAGMLTPEPQDNSRASHAPLLTREDGRINFSRPAPEAYNRWRGFQPWPGAWALLNSRKLTVVRMQVGPHAEGEPGTLWTRDGQLYASCAGSTAIELIEVQPEGKRAMAAADFLRGHPQAVGARLG